MLVARSNPEKLEGGDELPRHDELRVIISGGGTGGHIFPAVSIAKAPEGSGFVDRDTLRWSGRTDGDGKSTGSRV